MKIEMPGTRIAIACGLFIIVAAALPYAWTLDYPWLLDDHWAVETNPLVTGPFDPVAVVMTNAWGDEAEHRHIVNYRPLSVATLALNHAIGGLDPSSYRLTNVLLYATVCLLVFMMMRRLGVSLAPSTLVSCGFALHPVHVEVVMFVVNREELLSTIFILCVVFVVLPRTGLISDHGRRRWTPCSLLLLAILFALSIMSKETGAALLAIVPVLGLLWPGISGRLRSTLAPTLLLAALFGGYLALRWSALGHLGAAAIPWQDNPLVQVETGQRLLGAAAVVFEAFRLLVTPFSPTVDYSHDVLGIPASMGPSGPALGFVVIALVLTGVMYMHRRRPVSAFGFTIIISGWALVSHVVFPGSILLAERLLFLPSTGAAIALGGALDRTPNRLPAASTAAVVVFTVWCASFAIVSSDRIPDYKSAEALYTSSLANRPGSTRLNNNLGIEYMESNRPIEAERVFRRALAIDGTNADALNNLGLILGGTGRPREAAMEFEEALRQRPGFVHALNNLCWLLVRTGEFKAAKGPCEAAKLKGAAVDSALERIGEGTLP